MVSFEVPCPPLAILTGNINTQIKKRDSIAMSKEKRQCLMKEGDMKSAPLNITNDMDSPSLESATLRWHRLTLEAPCLIVLILAVST
ncbi:conserved hypothetical protein [Vibrio nigripulchritudo SOn1]|uniref:Uncharacterized protein n=1 Tax=Vibrio nigripulchritudo SOn1 TaxID=1238450 RepID=A0AAV2VZR2_9VIBR|nr:conserved hypothetical protein [Vibrio nigripulchritudo SOn1]